MDRWDGGSEYDVFMGRWSRVVAGRFVGGLDLPEGLRWLDVGCGTGALVEAILGGGGPSRVAAVDPSFEYVSAVERRFGDHVDVRVAGGGDLPFDDGSFDVVVSALVLNFIPDPIQALREFRRVAGSGGIVSAYVWDYADGMEFLRVFWDTATALDSSARVLDEATRFPICDPGRLFDAFEEAGLGGVEISSIDIATEFSEFDDFWCPFLSGQGPAPSYVAGLSDANRERLEKRLRRVLDTDAGSPIGLRARAWVATGSS